MIKNHFEEYLPEQEVLDVGVAFPLYYSDVKELTNIDFLYTTKWFLDKNPDIGIKLYQLSDKEDIANISQFVDYKDYFYEDEVVVGFVVGESWETVLKNLSLAFAKNEGITIEKNIIEPLVIIDVNICDKLKADFPLLKIVDRPGKQKTFLIGYYNDIEIDLGKKTYQIYKLIKNLCSHHDYFQEVFDLFEDIKSSNQRKHFKATKGTSEAVREMVEYIEGVVSNTNKEIKKRYGCIKMISMLRMENDSKQVKLILNKQI